MVDLMPCVKSVVVSSTRFAGRSGWRFFKRWARPLPCTRLCPSFVEVFGPSFRLKTEITGPYECRVEIEMRDDHEPFPEICAFGISLASTVPQLFGYAVAEIAQESCRCEGAALLCGTCCGGMPVDAEKANESRAEMRVRLLEARLDELQRTLAELGSGDGLQPVLNRVMAGAMRAVQAPSYILDIVQSASSDHFIRTEGIGEAEGSLVTLGLRESRGEEPPDNVLACDIVSDRVALRASGCHPSRGFVV